MLRLSVLAAFFAAVTFDASVAQGPTTEQRDAMRAACRSDFIANCSSVEPGGKEALDCLVRNAAKLSAPCKSAVSAAAPASAPAAATAPAAAPAPEVKAPAANAATTPAPTTEQDQLSAVRRACTLDDFVAHCSWIQPSSPEVLLCLKANAPDLSPGCQTVVQSLPPTTPPTAAEAPMTAPAATPTTAPAAPAAPAPAARASAPAPAAPTPKPSAQEISTIRAACRSDFIERCRGVQPGGSAAVACLKRNAARLSPSCRSALAAVGGGAPAAASAAPAAPGAATPPPAAASAAAVQPSADQISAIRAACRSDFMTNCRGVQPGGSAAMECLKRNAAGLSSPCQSALAAVGGGGGAASAAPSAPASAPAVMPLSPMPLLRPRRALAILEICAADQRAFCPGIPPGGGRLIGCLADNAPRLSPQCYDAMARARR